MKRFVLALYAQYRVSAEFEESMGARNGIRQTTHLFAETYICELSYSFIYELGLNLSCG